VTDNGSLYNLIPYEGGVTFNTSPGHLALCALWKTGARPPLSSFCYVELGCGNGANLLALAFYHKNATFIGIDNAESELNRAQKSSEALGLNNIQFLHENVRQLNDVPLLPCDYIVAHGLYSWVQADVRRAIFNFCQRHLSSSGLAYISYNAQPGWATRKLVRDVLRRNPRVVKAAIQDQSKRAAEVATQLISDLPSRDYAHAILLTEELERVKSASPGYLFHEYLTEVNEGFWLCDFVNDARKYSLDYVCDAQFSRWEGYVPPALQSTLKQRNLDPIQQEETADLLCHRSFHASILCRSDALPCNAPNLAILEHLFIASSLASQSDPFDLTGGVVENFVGTSDTDITLDTSITKAAVIWLARQWPRGETFGILYDQALKMLTESGFDAEEDARTKLAEDLFVLFEAGQIDLRLEEAEYDSNISSHPKAHALARYEALQGKVLTTTQHLPLHFSEEALLLISALEGTRSQQTLVRTHGKSLVDNTLEILARWGLLESH